MAQSAAKPGSKAAAKPQAKALAQASARGPAQVPAPTRGPKSPVSTGRTVAKEGPDPHA